MKRKQPTPDLDAIMDSLAEAVSPGYGALSMAFDGGAGVLRAAASELHRLRAVIRETHKECAGWPEGRHEHTCKLYEIETSSEGSA